VEAYSVETGELLWTFPLRSYVPQNLVASNGVVFVPETTVSALDGRTGKRIWEFTPDANASLGRAATDGRALYFGTAGHRLYALRTSDGRELWSRDIGPEWKDPAVIRGVTIWKDKGYATVEQWTTPNGRSVAGWLIAFRAVDGKILWRYRTEEGAQRRGLSSSPAVTEKFVVCADYLSNAVVAVQRKNGREAWRLQADSGFVGFPEAPVIQGRTVFVGSGDTHVYALELKSGHVLWRAKLAAASGAYALCGNNLLVNYGGLAVLTLDSGEVNQTLLSNPSEFVSSGLAVMGHRAYIAGPNAIYAFACR
jgi:outer membrane protein assembly factor BamB